MTKSSLDPTQQQIVKIIEALGFGVIERLSIRDGLPCYEREPRVVQTIKLDAGSELKAGNGQADLTLKEEFARLFAQLGELRDGIVDIEVRHGLPFRLVLERRIEGLL